MEQLSSHLKRFFDKAWGHPWPLQHTFKIVITRDELLGAGHEHESLENEYRASKPDEGSEWIYDCFSDMREISVILNMRGIRPDAVVVLEEYPLLLKALQTLADDRTSNALVTGHPGIGKTTFLLYILLHRLAHKLPTAFHVGGANFVLFQSSGATMESANCHYFFPDRCWALSDGNDINNAPCVAFNDPSLFVVHAASSCDVRAASVKRMRVMPLFLPLPKVSEIAAVISSRNIAEAPFRPPRRPVDLSYVATLVRSWGPCTRTIVDILLGYEVDCVRDAAHNSAWKLCANPALLGTPRQPLSGAGSDIFFLAPDPAYALDGLRTSRCGTAFIPTDTLAEIFSAELRATSNENVRDLFTFLSKRGSTRGWIHGLQMHAYMAGHRQGGQPSSLSIFGPNGEQGSIVSAEKLAPGTLASLKRLSGRPSQYWVPFSSDFSGIDGVLIDGTFISVFRVAVPSEDRDSSAGLGQLWTNLEETVRDAREWRVVVSGGRGEDEAINTVTTKLRAEVSSLALGPNRRTVSVWSASHW